MTGQILSPPVLLSISKAFCYPETWPDTGNLKEDSDGHFSKIKKNPPGIRLADLQNEYVRLFINSLPEVPCVPYGSYYLESVLMGPSTIHLKQLCHAYGFETDELADHIAVELEFLALLSHMIGKSADEKALQADYEFVLDHLKAWTPLFFACIQQHDKIGFYREISECAGRVVNGI